MAAAPVERTIDDLPDHVLTEVMLRVPTPAAIVHAAAVSKRWRGVIVTSTGKFLKDYRARHKSSPFLGLYIPCEFGGLPSFKMADSIQSADDDDDRNLDLQGAAAKALTFSLGILERHPEWRLLDCYNGRLLLARGGESLEVYNPLSRERISVGLPQDVILPDGFSTCLLQGHGDDGSSFRVVSVQSHRRDRMVHAAEYDSCRKSWNHHRDWKILKSIEGTQREVMHAGTLVFCKYTGASLVLLDTRKMQFSVLPLPADNNWKRYAIGEMEDGVCCLASVEPVGILNTPHLSVWRLEKLDWKVEKTMEVAQVLGNHAADGPLYFKARKVTNGMAVLCSSRFNQHFVIDLKTFRVMEKFEFNRDLPAFPMQMHWPPAFSVATISGEQSTPRDGAAARGGEVEGAETDGECEEEAAETGSKNEDAAEDSDTKGDPVASVPTPTAVEECFEKENIVPNNYDLEALIPDLCDRVSDLMYPEVTRLRRLERRESFVRLDHGAQCPFSVSNELHPDHRIKDSESPHAQQRKHKWGLIQVCIKEQRCLEDWYDSEGESLGSCEMDNVSLEGITDSQDYMEFQQMDSSNQCGNGNGVPESNTLVIPDQGEVEHGHINERVQERVYVQLIGQPEGSLQPDGAICTAVQDALTLQTNLDGQYVESKLNKDPEILCSDEDAILGRTDVCGPHDNGPELRDEGGLQNCVPSDAHALEDLGIQEPITTEQTSAQAGRRFDKIPVRDLSLCNEDSGLIRTEAKVQSNERLSSNAAQTPKERTRRSNRTSKPNPRVQGPYWAQ